MLKSFPSRKANPYVLSMSFYFILRLKKTLFQVLINKFTNKFWNPIFVYNKCFTVCIYVELLWNNGFFNEYQHFYCDILDNFYYNFVLSNIIENNPFFIMIHCLYFCHNNTLCALGNIKLNILSRLLSIHTLLKYEIVLLYILCWVKFLISSVFFLFFFCD